MISKPVITYSYKNRFRITTITFETFGKVSSLKENFFWFIFNQNIHAQRNVIVSTIYFIIIIIYWREIHHNLTRILQNNVHWLDEFIEIECKHASTQYYLHVCYVAWNEKYFLFLVLYVRLIVHWKTLPSTNNGLSKENKQCAMVEKIKKIHCLDKNLPFKIFILYFHLNNHRLL